MNASTRLAAAVAAVAFAVYALTAARTITFWDGAHYSLLARTLSISNPPGSLLLTLIGRVLGDVPFAWPMAFRLNLIAALIGAATAAVLLRLGAGVAGGPTAPAATGAITGAAVAALTWTFAITPWTNATQFTPYGLSALFTALILAAFVRWWNRADDPGSTSAAMLVALLLGLDVSVHRTNLVLAPALAAGLLLRRPRALASPRFLASLAGAFVLGAATQLLYIPISRSEPFLDVTSPDSLPALWGYLRMDPIGGGFLVDLWPRRADVVHVQLADVGRFVRANVGGGAWAWAVGVTLALVGLGAVARRSRRLALALLGFVLAAGLGAVVYLNRPANYFRTLDRHYLAFLVTLMPLLAAGVASIVDALRARAGRIAAAVPILCALALPLSAGLANFRACNLSRTRFAETYGRDLIEPLPRGTLLLTNGDNDSFPPWYLQEVENVRRDVLVVNVPCAWTRAGARRLRRFDPALASFAPSESLVADVTRRCLGKRPVYFAVTLALPAPIPGISERLRIEGLAWRVAPPGDETTGARSALERFVRERLPRAGFDDPRQRLDEDLKLLGINYAAAAFQLAAAQMREGDGRGALATLDALERYYPAWRLPPGSEALRESLAQGRRQAEELVSRERAR